MELQGRNPAIALLIAIGFGCQQTPPPSPLDRIPAHAHLAIVVGRSVMHTLRNYAAPDEEARAELSQYLVRTVGVDLTKVEEIILFATEVEPNPQVAVLLTLPGPIHFELPQEGSRAGVNLYRAAENALAAPIPGGVVIGMRAAVEAAVDVAQKQAPAIGDSSPLASLRRNFPPNADFVIGLHLDEKSSEQVVQMARGVYGVHDGVLSIAGSKVMLTLAGDPAKLPMARSAFLQARDVALTQSRLQKESGQRGDDLLMGTASISGYHQLRRMFQKLEPKLARGQLVIETDMPKGDAAMFVPVVGILAAVAIPAFMKYIRRSKTTEAAMNVRKLADASVAYYEGFHKFPPSTDWTPAIGCCKHPDGHCPPQPAAWNAPTWQALYFAIEDPFYYQYRYTSERGHFVAEARGDLNCDGVYSSYKREGRVDAKGNVQVTPLAVQNDLE